MGQTADPWKTVAIVQARMGSSRLPGKVLLDIVGQPMLAHVVERTRLARTVDEVVVASTVETSDDAIRDFCIERDFLLYRGSLHDVLDRYYQAAKMYNAGVIVRITADCPLIDPEVIDQTVTALFDGSEKELIDNKPKKKRLAPLWDFAANRLPPPWKRTFPIGLDTEVCTFSALEEAWLKADQAYQREHVMPYLYEQTGRFRVLLVNHEPDYGQMRWTVDTPEDLELVRKIFNHFNGRNDFSWLEVIDLFEQEPALAEINADVQHKFVNDVDARHDLIKDK